MRRSYGLQANRTNHFIQFLHHFLNRRIYQIGRTGTSWRPESRIGECEEAERIGSYGGCQVGDSAVIPYIRLTMLYDCPESGKIFYADRSHALPAGLKRNCSKYASCNVCVQWAFTDQNSTAGEKLRDESAKMTGRPQLWWTTSPWVDHSQSSTLCDFATKKLSCLLERHRRRIKSREGGKVCDTPKQGLHLGFPVIHRMEFGISREPRKEMDVGVMRPKAVNPFLVLCSLQGNNMVEPLQLIEEPLSRGPMINRSISEGNPVVNII